MNAGVTKEKLISLILQFEGVTLPLQQLADLSPAKSRYSVPGVETCGDEMFEKKKCYYFMVNKFYGYYFGGQLTKFNINYRVWVYWW
ncbi:hypothetical protein S83_036095 [Arachis hypogaea]